MVVIEKPQNSYSTWKKNLRSGLLKYGQTNKNERKQKKKKMDSCYCQSKWGKGTGQVCHDLTLPTSVWPRKALSRLYFSGTFNYMFKHYLSITPGFFLRHYFLINWCIYVNASHSTCMEVRRTTRGSFFPPCGFWGSDSGRQLWRRALLPAEAFLQPPVVFFEE